MMMGILAWFAAGQLATATPQAAAPSAAPPAPDAVEIVLYSDFQCPFCAQLSAPFRQVQTEGVDGVKPTVHFKNFPLSIHPRARLAHLAAMAAGEQGKFWEMHDLLFTNQQHAARADFLGFAKQLHLDLKRFEAALDSPRLAAIVDADIAEGNRVSVEGTPTFYVNGKAYVGARSADQLRQIVRDERRRVRAVAEITDDVMSKGPRVARVTIEFFADLQSPVTAPADAVLSDVMKRYPSDVRVQFRNFPLAFHPQAPLAHEAAMTAARGGRFWDFESFLLSHQDAVREQDLIALAGRLGLDEARFADDLREHRYAPRVEADVQAGSQRGIRGSPVIVVNGKRIDGVPSLQTLTEYVEAALAARP